MQSFIIFVLLNNLNKYLITFAVFKKFGYIQIRTLILMIVRLSIKKQKQLLIMECFIKYGKRFKIKK